jgi:hypothetical protein
MRLRDLVLVAIALIAVAAPANAQAVRTTCDPDEQPFFICETNRKDKYVAICATEVEVGKRWSAIQYRYGKEDKAELVYPQNANGKTVADIQCIERPTLFAPYMQMALACDLENPHGKAACAKDPLHLPAEKHQSKAPRKSPVR